MPDLLKLPDIPKDYLYEDYIAAYLQASGMYIERSIIHRDIDEILELDIVSSNITPLSVDKKLIEIKSGGWGYSDLFKVKGWMSFLNIHEGAFVAQKFDRDVQYCTQIADEMNINLINNSDLTKTKASLEPLILNAPDEASVNWTRFAFAMEHAMLKEIKSLKKSDPDVISYKHMDNFFHAITSRSFFKSDPLTRVHRIFSSYTTYKNLSAKQAKELETGSYDNDCNEIPYDYYRKLFYAAENSPIHISLYIEHLARLYILKSCVDYLIQQKSENQTTSFVDHIRLMTLPKTLKKGLEEISNDTYFHRYPAFWQTFTYLLGGIIMQDYKEEDYGILSKISGIPTESIDDAFNAFGKLFPKEEGWFMSFPNSNILWHRLFPIPFCGIGVNYRRCAYAKSEKFEDLTKITGVNTMKDVIKWNRLAFEITSTLLPVIHTEDNK